MRATTTVTAKKKKRCFQNEVKGLVLPKNEEIGKKGTRE